MNEESNPEPKISGPEGALMIGLAGVFDLLDFLATFLDGFFGAGEVVKFFINVIASVTLWLWAMIKGVGPERTLAAALMEFVPLINTLPLRTAATAATVWLDWHPEEAELAEKITPNIKNPRRRVGATARAAKNPKTTQSA